MRKVSLHLEKEFVEKLQHELGREFLNAIAYLSLWSMTYDDVEIYRDGKGNDLIAYYRRTEGGAQYTIGAIWREGEGKYSFHS
jgi:hypothetical protein